MNFVLQPWQLALAVLAGWVNRQQQQAVEYLRASRIRTKMIEEIRRMVHKEAPEIQNNFVQKVESMFLDLRQHVDKGLELHLASVREEMEQIQRNRDSDGPARAARTKLLSELEMRLPDLLQTIVSFQRDMYADHG